MKTIKLSLILLSLCLFIRCSSSDSNNSIAALVLGPNMVDVDNNTYPSVVIGTQTWTQKNLYVLHYRNGDPIPYKQSYDSWWGSTTGAYCLIGTNSATGIVYGVIYNRAAIMDPRGLVPFGWHIPSSEEWYTLSAFLGGEAVAGGKMKSVNSWFSPNTGATNSSGFNALPSGYRDNQDLPPVGFYCGWWSTTLFNANGGGGISFLVSNQNSAITSGMDTTGNNGYYVRCIKN